MSINVLVFPCGSEIGLEIHAALKYCKDIVLHGVSSVSDHGEFTYVRYREISAHAASPELAEQLNQLIDEWQVDIILPAHDSAIVRLAELRAELHAKVAVPALEQAQLCRNKNATYAFFQGESFIPTAVHGLAVSYPIFAKPAVGQGSQGAELITSAQRHKQLMECGIEYVFSEYLPGAEYTVDCISDSAGTLIKAAPRKRSRVKSGISVRTEPVAVEPEMSRIAECLAGRLLLPGA
jgi:carbamoylphosphate synthase large subunit